MVFPPYRANRALSVFVDPIRGWTHELRVAIMEGCLT
jgi:hypothetical protein